MKKTENYIVICKNRESKEHKTFHVWGTKEEAAAALDRPELLSENHGWEFTKFISQPDSEIPTHYETDEDGDVFEWKKRIILIGESKG